jgi:hypothetical protein
MATIVSLMREILSRNKFAVKKDLFAIISQKSKLDHSIFEQAIDKLLQDGTIFTTYSNDVLSMEL